MAAAIEAAGEVAAKVDWLYSEGGGGAEEAIEVRPVPYTDDGSFMMVVLAGFGLGRRFLNAAETNRCSVHHLMR